MIHPNCRKRRRRYGALLVMIYKKKNTKKASHIVLVRSLIPVANMDAEKTKLAKSG